MCATDAATMAKLGKTVEEFVTQQRMFTGYDITVETRSREAIKLRHKDVRSDIHEIQALVDACEFGAYDKTQVQKPDGHWVFVYHPNNLDPNNYQFQNSPSTPTTAPAAPAAPAAAPTPAASSDDDDDDDDDDVTSTTDSGGKLDDGSYATDYRNRLLIQTKFLKEAGLNPGGMVFVTASVGKMTLSKDDPGNGVPTQLVERNGDLRLSSKTLKGAGLTGTKFQVENQGGKVEITGA